MNVAYLQEQQLQMQQQQQQQQTIPEYDNLSKDESNPPNAVPTPIWCCK